MTPSDEPGDASAQETALDTRRKAFKRSVDRLQELELIMIWDEFFWLPDNRT